MRRQSITVKQSVKTGRPDEDKEKYVFDIYDFINETDEAGDNICDDKGKELGSRPHANNIKQELF
jgi:hypothetical protein